MPERSVTHDTFAVERTYDASPARVFAAWADPEAKSSWFGPPDEDIVPDERIVYAYDMHLEDTRISVSLSTVELKPDGDATRLIYTEQGAYLDGLDSSEQRQGGTGGLLDALGEYLARNR